MRTDTAVAPYLDTSPETAPDGLTDLEYNAWLAEWLELSPTGVMTPAVCACGGPAIEANVCMRCRAPCCAACRVPRECVPCLGCDDALPARAA